MEMQKFILKKKSLTFGNIKKLLTKEVGKSQEYRYLLKSIKLKVKPPKWVKLDN